MKSLIKVVELIHDLQITLRKVIIILTMSPLTLSLRRLEDIGDSIKT